MRIDSNKWAALTSVVLIACGGPSGAVGDNSTLLEGSRGDESVREQCVASDSTVVTEDVNGDGTPDIRHVTAAGGVRRCTEVDFDFDGAPDLTRFYADDGQTPVREEHDLDFDGRMDQIAYFEAGRLARKELDTNFNNRIDTWMWCEGGAVARAERDRRNDGDVDTWETYDDGLLTEAAYDDNGDDTAEKWEVFRNGRLIEIRHDTDRDGEPDRAEEIPADSSGLPEERIDCELVDRSQRDSGEENGDSSQPANGTVPSENADEGDSSGDTTPPEPTGDPITDGIAADEAAAAEAEQ